MGRKSKGRQRVEMVKMKNESNLQVTFSKRRSGLIKKANELCTLCGAEVAIIVFSPGQKVFSYGHPGVNAIIDRYLDRIPMSANGSTDRIVEAHRNANVRELNLELTHVENMLEAEKKRGEALNQMRKSNEMKHWWEAPIEELNMQQLEQLKKAMEGLKKNIDDEVRKFMIQAANVNSYILHTNIFGRSIVPPGPSTAPPLGFSRSIPFSARETDSTIMAAHHLNSRASESTSSYSPHGFDHGYCRFF